jgi:hypothetical protein
LSKSTKKFEPTYWRTDGLLTIKERIEASSS